MHIILYADRCIREFLHNKLIVLVTHQVQFAVQADKLLVLKEGKVHLYGTQAELEERGVNTTQLLGLIKTAEEEKDDEFEYDEEESDFEEEGCMDLNIVQRSSSVPSVDSVGIVERHDNERSKDKLHEERSHGSVSVKTYYQFFRAGGCYIFLLMTFFFLVAEGAIVVADWWIADWAECSVLNSSMRSTCDLTTEHRIAIYSSATVALVIFNFIRGILLYLLCINASRVLHNRMFASILRTPCLFFDSRPSGQILNRFSKDIGYLDDLLPQTLLESLVLATRFTAVVLTASVANVYVVMPAALLSVLCLALRWYYLKTAREVHRLEAIARSPLYSHVSQTLQGLPTIRSLGKQNLDRALEQLHYYQNKNSQGYYLNLVLARWFSIRIDTLVALFVAAVAFTSIPLSSQLSASLVGLGLTYSISLSDMLQSCVRQSSQVENIMVSTERIMSYSHLDPEASLETLPPNEKPPSNWPEKGKITFEDISFQYSPDLPLVLKNVSFTIKPSEKVGIVGRTGAGKSSLISVLYRLAEPFGVITIDGVDTKSIGLHDLRKKMSIIPQDPVLFSGTMRYNLDPFDEYSDTELWDALEQVQLKADVQELDGQLGSEVTEGGSNFSVGQRQLVCLARALLRKNKILVLDEATANVDHHTDKIIQDAIRERFSKCSVLTIAHRLNTIMDSDRILVMNRGRVSEFDTPCHLLQNSNTLFYKMVETTGPVASQKLHRMAHDARLLRRRRSSAHAVVNAPLNSMLQSSHSYS